MEFGNQLAAALVPPERVRSRRAWLASIPVAAVGGLAWGWLLKPQLPVEERILTFRTLVQRYGGGAPGDPFWSKGPVSFSAGDHIRLVVSSPQPGYLYLLNEAPGANGTFNVLFPSMAAAGSALVAAGMETPVPSASEYFEFDDQAGDERLWMVWAKNPPPELEAVKKWVNPRNRGTVDDTREATSVRSFIVKNSLHSPRLETDSSGTASVVRLTGTLLVYLLQMHHQ